MFYFNVYNHETTIDDVGIDLPDLAAAKKEALNAAADLIRDEIVNGRKLHSDHRIQVEDADHDTVHVLRFGELIAG